MKFFTFNYEKYSITEENVSGYFRVSKFIQGSYLYWSIVEGENIDKAIVSFKKRKMSNEE